jgi:hypothetical protein
LYNFFKEKLHKTNEATLKGMRLNDFVRNKRNFEINSQTESLELKYDKRAKIYNDEDI